MPSPLGAAARVNYCTDVWFRFFPFQNQAEGGSRKKDEPFFSQGSPFRKKHTAAFSYPVPRRGVSSSPSETKTRGSGQVTGRRSVGGGQVGCLVSRLVGSLVGRLEGRLVG